tara:strand:+ start:499 stop:735 length:237 start_codon:yes stop_codon:yes gene_type:complete
MAYDIKTQNDDWFDQSIYKNPLDRMPIAKDPEDLAPSSYEPQDDEEITMHEKMYRMATEKHSPWKGGGSENFNHSGLH